jgi:hypothetical protein
MQFNTKRKIKKWFKEKWKWLLGSGIFLTAGLVVMLVGFSMTGWSIIEWLKSPFCTTTIVCVLIGAFLLILAFAIKKQVEIFNE